MSVTAVSDGRKSFPNGSLRPALTPILRRGLICNEEGEITYEAACRPCIFRYAEFGGRSIGVGLRSSTGHQLSAGIGCSGGLTDLAPPHAAFLIDDRRGTPCFQDNLVWQVYLHIGRTFWPIADLG